MPELFPLVTVTTGPMIPIDGFLTQAPVCWQTLAEGWNTEDGSAIDGGRYLDTKGAVQGHGVPKLQDTYRSSGGIGGLTGRAFDVVTGTWKDDWVIPHIDKHALLFPDSSAGVSGEIVSNDTTTGIEPAEILVYRGFPPAASDPAHTKTGRYAYLHLCHGVHESSGISQDYRLAIEWGQPIRLDYSQDAGATWKAIKIFRDLGQAEHYLRNHDNHVRLRVLVDRKKHRLDFEVGDGAFAYHTPKNLPSAGRIRFIGQNGWMGLGYFPMRFQPVTVTKSKRDFGEPIQSPYPPFVVGNQHSVTPDNQATAIATNTDGQNFEWQIQANLPDAGDGLGSLLAPELSDATVVFPANWTFDDGGLGGTFANLRVMRVDERQSFDDMARTLITTASVISNNFDLLYTGLYGHAWCQIEAAVAFSVNGTLIGFTDSVRLTGVAGVGPQGLTLIQEDPVRLFKVLCQDHSYKMMWPWNQECSFDGWYIGSVVRYLCVAGNIHPQQLTALDAELPLYVPPGATIDDPYGPAGTDLPDTDPVFFALPRGTGNNPRFRYGMEWSPWAILQDMVQRLGLPDVTTGLSRPYFMGFDVDGNFHFAPYDPYFLLSTQPVLIYSSNAAVTGGIPIESIAVDNSIENLRTSIDFQGIDSDTNELLYLHIPGSDDVKRRVGFKRSWTERSAKYASEDYMETVAMAAAAQASLATQFVRFRAPFVPTLYAGSVIGIFNEGAIGGFDYFVVNEILSCYGMSDVTGGGFVDCYSVIIGRNIASYLFA